MDGNEFGVEEPKWLSSKKKKTRRTHNNNTTTTIVCSPIVFCLLPRRPQKKKVYIYKYSNITLDLMTSVNENIFIVQVLMVESITDGGGE